ncbi:hypothetical protein AVEN_274124-1 [Araneus ventricosus]|uniref:Uncharacterized protein n=1 Tax=Araneus ventricosus TaxID=182803 RepID=A0A4Y2KWV3_ARAVE|nr:hypothetical protein AVEN_274124-1 [Araneus ventricosus]
MNEVDEIYGSCFSNNESSANKNETGDDKNETGDDKNETGDVKNEPSYDMDESGDGKDESSYDMDESGVGKVESSYDMDESSDAEIEMAKKVLLNLLADKEKEITELVLHLIYTFSCFNANFKRLIVYIHLLNFLLMDLT